MSEIPHDNEEVVHVYDDIEELDNRLPRWWVLLFYITSIFAPIYMAYYHVTGIGLSTAEKFEKSETEFAAMVTAKEERAAASGEVRVLEPSSDLKVLEKGKTAFMTYCVACHFADGGGMVGPNLTDDYWLNGPTFADSVKTIQEGVPERGMIPWKTMLKPADIEALASYIYTFRGKTAANPKGAEGKKYDAEGNVVDEKPRLLAPPAPATP